MDSIETAAAGFAIFAGVIAAAIKVARVFREEWTLFLRAFLRPAKTGVVLLIGITVGMQYKAQLVQGWPSYAVLGLAVFVLVMLLMEAVDVFVRRSEEMGTKDKGRDGDPGE